MPVKILLKKLGKLFVGPFRIRERRGLVNYKLILPNTIRIYPVFYVSLLRLADPETLIDYRTITESAEEFEVERIIKYNARTKEYLVKWTGYPETENTWIPLRNFADPRMPKDFH